MNSQPPDESQLEEIEKERKQNSAYMYGSAVLRLTKLCAPKCLDYKQVQIQQTEKQCLTSCVRGLHGVTESTLNFLSDFEEESKKKQNDLILELAGDIDQERATAKALEK